MPKISSGRHTAASLQIAATKIRQIAEQIEQAAFAFKTVKDADDVKILYESSLIDGTNYLQQWADAARNAVYHEKLRFDRKRGVSAKSDAHPEGESKPQKSTRK